MSLTDIGLDPIRAFSYDYYRQTREEWIPTRISNDIDVIKRAAANVKNSQYKIEVAKVGEYIEWKYDGKPPIYIRGHSLYSQSHSREAHENAARVISILVKNNAADARRVYPGQSANPTKKFRILNEITRTLSHNLSQKDKRLLFHLATTPGWTISTGDLKGQLPRKRAEKLAKKGYIVIREIDGRSYVEANPALEKAEAILYADKEKRSIPPLEKIL